MLVNSIADAFAERNQAISKVDSSNGGDKLQCIAKALNHIDSKFHASDYSHPVWSSPLNGLIQPSESVGGTGFVGAAGFGRRRRGTAVSIFDSSQPKRLK